jgi:hypothetical protein
MDQFLAEYYGTNKTAAASVPSPEEIEKQAQVELFCKLAAEQKIDLRAMPNEQVEQLFSGFVSKLASEPDDDERDDKDKKKDEEKKAAAERELAEKRAAAEKLAEADFLGRAMAHAYVDELGKIAAAAEKEDEKPDAGEKKDDDAKEAGMPEALRRGLERAGKHVKGVGEGVAKRVGEHVENVGKKVTEKATGVGAHSMKPSHAKAVGAGAYGAGAAAAGGAAAGAHRAATKEKKSSAIDQLALERAVEKAAAEGFDPHEAARRLDAGLTLDLFSESTKVASVPNLAAAVDIRALELLEAVGYPVEWAAA